MERPKPWASITTAPGFSPRYVIAHEDLPDGATALSELRRKHDDGACFVVILWPAFWWLEEYVELNDYLSDCTCLVRNECLLVFDMSTQQMEAAQRHPKNP